MAPHHTVKLLEHSQISPPSCSVQQTTTLPLTFFDIPWILFSPNQPLFFYEFPYPITFFTSTTLPNLKHSLSLTLQHFYPLTGHLSSPPKPGKPSIVYSHEDYVSFTVSESDFDFSHLCQNYPKSVEDFYPLVPQLVPSKLLAVQVTIFENLGLSIGLSYRHVVADGRTFNNFLKTWASICRLGSDPNVYSVPFYDRTVIKARKGLETLLLQDYMVRATARGRGARVEEDMVRATFVMGQPDMERIKQWIVTQCKQKDKSIPVLLSAYVLTCSYVWVCLIKSQENVNHEEPIVDYLGFVAGGITRLDYPVPVGYFGNCVAFGRTEAMRSELLGEDGIIFAAEAIGSTVKKLDGAVLGGAENWIKEWDVFFGPELQVMVSGSPKVDLYETDFGWGMPMKIEDISIDSTRGIALTQSRDMKGGIEVGLVLSRAKMDAFTSLFAEGLKVLQ